MSALTYPMWNHDKNIITACSVDIRILVARYHGLKRRVGQILEAKKIRRSIILFSGIGSEN
ncbi:hypothetical protein [Bartonella bilalgolemii]|uniref:Uncharacterized protein n=1 Tax=Bartonella bilalgolemii TaxID=2942911 RepID=A0ABT0P930_9HYPH|nr:hypothetical protein [Bartonella sp. G70]MCL6229984.1 hypothetical protein [Bartonella sp. G70]